MAEARPARAPARPTPETRRSPSGGRSRACRPAEAGSVRCVRGQARCGSSAGRAVGIAAISATVRNSSSRAATGASLTERVRARLRSTSADSAESSVSSTRARQRAARSASAAGRGPGRETPALWTLRLTLASSETQKLHVTGVLNNRYRNSKPVVWAPERVPAAPWHSQPLLVWQRLIPEADAQVPVPEAGETAAESRKAVAHSGHAQLPDSRVRASRRCTSETDQDRCAAQARR
jgi:hypothetical protein